LEGVPIRNLEEETMRKTGLGLLAAVLILAAGAAFAQNSPAGKVQMKGKTLFVINSGIEQLTPEERAQAISRRLQTILNSPPAKMETHIGKADAGLQVMIGNEPIVTVTEGDAKAAGISQQELAEQWAATIQQNMSESAAEGSWRALLLRVGLTILILAAALVILILLRRGRRALKRYLESRRRSIPSVRFRGLELLSSHSVLRVLTRLLWVAYGIAGLVVTVAALLIVFAQIPDTRGYAYQVFLWLWDPFVAIMKGVLAYLPNLFYILVIVVVTRIAIRAVNFVFEQAHRGVISLEPWVHSDVARPTAQIFKVVMIVLALFFIAPLIPGTGSTAARGISVILGLMVSFGSSSTVGNIIAGVVLTYMRPFQVGERVKVGDTSGDVLERTFLYTKIRTIKNEQVIVPSLLALSNNMVNYSTEARGQGLILHTSVTIGYDAPWRKVHELLLRAADRTQNVLKNPKPFVLQTALNDFFVNYQLNAYTDAPNAMAETYSTLHQNIQDSFNEGGIEILSPHYFQLRDGNTTTIPQDYRPADYQPDRFLVDARSQA
jgi:small-conductance mechanosensitive channel